MDSTHNAAPTGGVPQGWAAVASAIRRLAESRPDLTPPAAVVLLSIVAHPGENLTEIRRPTGLRWWVFNRAVSVLMREGHNAPALAVRADSVRDRRAVLLWPTPAGRGLVDAATSMDSPMAGREEGSSDERD